MGLTHVRVTVRNPADTERSWEGNFLVDTGAIDPLVPRQHLEAIGVGPKGRRTYGLADGTKLEMKVGVAQLELLGDLVGSTVIFGPENAEPLLGVTALESLGVEVDPANQRLGKLPSIPLKPVGWPLGGPQPVLEAPPPSDSEQSERRALQRPRRDVSRRRPRPELEACPELEARPELEACPEREARTAAISGSEAPERPRRSAAVTFGALAVAAEDPETADGAAP